MNDGDHLLLACDASPGDRTPVLVLADWCEEQGWVESAQMLRGGLGFVWKDVAGGYGGYGDDGGGGGYGGGYGGDGYGGDGGGYGGVYGDGGDGYGGDGDGGGGYGDGDGGYGDGDGDGDRGDGDGDGDGGYGDGYGGYGGGYNYKLSRGFVMQSGLYIICSPAGYYPYVRVGWLSRADGLIRLRNSRVIRWFGSDAQLAEIAKSGPKENTQLLAAADEYTSVGLISRAIPCDPKSWRKECPMPPDFTGE